MNRFNKIAAFTIFLVSFSLGAWSGEQVIMGKNNKCFAFIVQYCDNEKDFFRELTDTGDFRWGSQKARVRIDFATGDIYMCALAHQFAELTDEQMDDTCRKIINGFSCFYVDEFVHAHFGSAIEFGMPEVLRDYNSITVQLIALDKDKSKYDKIIQRYKKAMEKITHENPGITFMEASYENSEVFRWVKYREHPNGGRSMNAFNLDAKPLTNSWTKLKNFVWNEKFLYAMGGLSALYLGYEYIKQH